MITGSVRHLIRASRKYELPWRYGFNLAPVLSYNSAQHLLSTEAARVVAELNRRGVAITSVESLLGSGSCYPELKQAVDELESELADELSAARANANREPGTIGQKTFNRELLGSNPILDPEIIYARFALQNPILQIANAYFRMYTRLRYYNVWHTFATNGEARESQLWHYDREDRYILKVFVYFSDVDDGAGPFTYAPGTHLKKKLRRQPEFFVEGGVRRSNDRQMSEIVSPQQWVKCTGSKGTIVFADTRGYHKGGMAHEHDRVMYTCMFTSQASQSKELFKRAPAMLLPSDRQLSFALSNLK
jgi:hypothetical protein